MGSSSPAWRKMIPSTDTRLAAMPRMLAATCSSLEFRKTAPG